MHGTFAFKCTLFLLEVILMHISWHNFFFNIYLYPLSQSQHFQSGSFKLSKGSVCKYIALNLR